MYTYSLSRSDRKTISLSISKALEVIVKAPLLMPKCDIDRFIADHDDWIRKNLEKQYIKNIKYPEPTEEEIKQLRKAAKEYLPLRVKYFSEMMGVEPGSVRITGAATRFGSCSEKNNICFSYRLMRYPSNAIDYVVVHELAHIRFKDHSERFYAFIERYMPDYRERRKLLK